MPPLPLPPVWAIVLSILALLFGGTYGIVWMIRREIRRAGCSPAWRRRNGSRRNAPPKRSLACSRVEKEAMAEMRQLLAASREESSAAQVEAHKARTESGAAPHQGGGARAAA